jgi:hypothetical protein
MSSVVFIATPGNSLKQRQILPIKQHDPCSYHTQARQEHKRFNSMVNYSSKGRGLACIALAIAAGILSSYARPLTRPSGYLAKTGPSPLRFQPPRGPMNLPPLPNESRNPSVEISTNSTAPGPDASSLVLPASPLAGPLSDPITNASVPEETNSQGNPPPAANDLLTVTPQMLADYFKLVPGWTNAAHINMLGPVYFMPPMAPPPSSSATYKNE